MGDRIGPARATFEVHYLCPGCEHIMRFDIGAWKAEEIPLTSPCRNCKQEQAMQLAKPKLVGVAKEHAKDLRWR